MFNRSMPPKTTQGLPTAESANSSQNQLTYAEQSTSISSLSEQKTKSDLATFLLSDDKAVTEESRTQHTSINLYSGVDPAFAKRTIDQNTFNQFKANLPGSSDPANIQEDDFLKYLDRKGLPAPLKKHGTWCRFKTFFKPGAATTTTTTKGKAKGTDTAQVPRTFAELRKARDGTNATQLFLNNPGEFLQEVPIIEHLEILRDYAELDESLKRPGKINFILETYRNGAAVRLKPVLNTYRNSTDQVNLHAQLAQGPQIQAHWLPWKPGETTHITLDSTCPFFFTSQLAGCRIAMRRDDPILPQIAHVAGSSTQGPTTGTWRKRETQKLFGHLHHPSRIEILTAGSGSDVPSENRYADEGVNLVGVFDATKKAWEFTRQDVDFDNLAVKTRSWGREQADQG
jgi:hypothetical protein